MMYEFETVWLFIKENGALLAHDVWINNSFLDFCDDVWKKPVIFKTKNYLSVIKKSEIDFTKF